MSEPPWFRDAADARTYLFEIGRLWLVWIATLALLFAFQEWWALLVIGVAFLAAMAILGRPLQERAARIPNPDAPAVAGRGSARGRRRREVAMRRLMYGEEPLREAIALTSGSSLLIWVRRLMLVLTVVAFLWVMVGLAAPPD